MFFQTLLSNDLVAKKSTNGYATYLLGWVFFTILSKLISPDP
jgi:hypothetical protein